MKQAGARGQGGAATGAPLLVACRGVTETAQSARRTKPSRQCLLSVRVNVLQADISTARKARRLTQEQADRLWQQAGQVRSDATHFVKLQGFLSAAERASYDRELDELAGQLCHRVQ